MSKSFSDQLDEILGVEIKRPSWVGIRHQLSRTNLVWIRRSEYEAMVRNLLALIEKEVIGETFVKNSFDERYFRTEGVNGYITHYESEQAALAINEFMDSQRNILKGGNK